MTPDELRRQELSDFLRTRRGRISPTAVGLPLTDRRRTPGLRREEVAQRANISPAWYTWLEQGRGGAPSADVLDRIARALMLTETEREHLFLLGLGRPPEVRYERREGVTPRLQRILDALDPSPALIRTATWDVVAWNKAATVMLIDYGSLPPEQRNTLRFMFLDPFFERLDVAELVDAVDDFVLVQNVQLLLLHAALPAAAEPDEVEARHLEILGAEEDPRQADEMEHDDDRQGAHPTAMGAPAEPGLQQALDRQRLIAGGPVGGNELETVGHR